MTKFWPRRAAPEGFSIEKLAKSSRAKLAQSSSKTFLSSNSHSYPNFNNELTPNIKNEFISSTSHWANRGFDEYHEAA